MVRGRVELLNSRLAGIVVGLTIAAVGAACGDGSDRSVATEPVATQPMTAQEAPKTTDPSEAPPTTEATEGGERVSFEYETARGYRYRFDLDVSPPTFSSDLGDPGEVRLYYSLDWVTVSVTNITGSRDAPLGTPNPGGIEDLAVVNVSAYIPASKEIAPDVHHLDCDPSAARCYVALRRPLALPLSALPIGQSTTLETGRVAAEPAGRGFVGRVPEDRVDLWSSALSSPPSYYFVSVDTFFDPFGNQNSNDYACPRSGLIAMIEGNGEQVALTEAACERAKTTLSAAVSPDAD